MFSHSRLQPTRNYPQIIRDAVDAHLVAEELRAKLKARVGTVSPRFPQGSSQPISVR
jgi:hypothetical protein